MGWVAIISALIEVFGPLLAQALQRWLERRLSKSATALNYASYDSETEARRALLDHAIGEEGHPLRRRILIMIRDHSV